MDTTETMMSPTIAKLAEALAAAQASLGAVAKDRDVTVAHKGGGSHSYSYATLAAVWDAVRAALPANGLSVVQGFRTVPPATTLRTVLLHKSGEWIASEIPVGISDDPQTTGSRISYLKRYSLAALVGITSADEDDDGAAGCAGDTHGDAPARTYTNHARSMPAGGAGHVIKFGNEYKGKPISDPAVPVSFLTWYLGKIREGAADPANQYQAANAAAVPVIEAEIARRSAAPSPAPAGPPDDEQGGAADSEEMVLLKAWRGRYAEAAKRGKSALDVELRQMLESVTDVAVAKQLQIDYQVLADKFAARAAAR